MAATQSSTQSVNPQSQSSTPSSEEASLPYVRHSFSPRYRVPIAFPDEGRTKQSFKDECDINVIMAKYQATGVLEHTKEAMPQFLDVSAVDFQTSMDMIAHGREVFASLPSHIRERFQNSPVNLLAWVEDPANEAEAISLGFLNPKPTASPVSSPTGIPEGGSQVDQPKAG